MANWFVFLFQTSGRASRSDIWLKFAAPFVVLLVLAVPLDLLLERKVPATGLGWLTVGVLVFFSWPSLAVAIKRVHDRGMGAVWAVLFQVIVLVSAALIAWPMVSEQAFVSVLGYLPLPTFAGIMLAATNAVYAFVILYCLAGDTGENAYGDDPLAEWEGSIARDNVRIFE